MIIVGDKEKNNNTISVRAHKRGDLGTFNTEEFFKSIEEENNLKSISK